MPQLKRKEMIGKDRIDRKVGSGGFATVYSAFDTIEGRQVALKLPRRSLLSAVDSPRRVRCFQVEGPIPAS